MTNKPGPRRAQEPSDSTSQNFDAVEVGDGATRYDWSMAFTRMCLRKGYPARTIAAAMRLVEELPRRQGQCDPLREDMADELGVSNRTIDRGYEDLEADGWISRQRTGRGSRNDAVIITLMIPSEDADIHRFGNKSGVGIRDTRVSRDEPVHTRHKTGDHATQNGSIRDTQDVASKEQIQKEQSAAPPRAPEYADRESQAFQELIELRPLTHPSQEPAARAAFGALIKTARIEDILDDACGLDERMPKDCVNYLASLTSNNPITAASS
jgi:hypothetical protein